MSNAWLTLSTTRIGFCSRAFTKLRKWLISVNESVS
jgi:hypothetical protein